MVKDKNFIVGVSHVVHMFDSNDVIRLNEKVSFIKSKMWNGLSYHYGRTIYYSMKTIIMDLKMIDLKDIFCCKNIVYVLGTADAVRNNKIPPKDFIYEYIQSIEMVRVKYGFKKAFVLTPFYINKVFDGIPNLRTTNEANIVIEDIRNLIIKESKKYKNIISIDVTDIFTEDNQKFHNKYNLDGVHFNGLGREKFINRIISEINKVGG